VRLAVLDIIPTATMWSLMDAKRALRTYHWSMLAQPAPMPETLLAGAPLAWLDHTLASWTAKRSLEDFDPRALAHYRAAFNDPSHIHALCEDYRAGATVDREDDEADLAAGRRITSPTLALWGRVGIPAGGRSPGEIWADWATDLSTHVVEAGHFVAEEDPVGTLAALNRFLSST
jgi:haloacetate dehalogenase